MKVFTIPGDGDLLLIQRIRYPSHLPHAGKSVPAHGGRDSMFSGGVGPSSTPSKTAIPLHPPDGQPPKNNPKRLTGAQLQISAWNCKVHIRRFRVALGKP